MEASFPKLAIVEDNDDLREELLFSCVTRAMAPGARTAPKLSGSICTVTRWTLF